MEFSSKLSIICVLIFLINVNVSSLHLSSRQHGRAISKECCKIKGGFECGNTFKDCCVPPKDTPKQKLTRDLCVSGGIFNTSQYCPGQKITQPCNYCQKQCEQKKGSICGLSNGELGQCCLKQDCIPDIDFSLKLQKCKPGKEIQLSNCITDMSLADDLLGQMENAII